MSAIRTISETADAFVPSLGGDAEDEPTMYKCRNCGRDAKPDADRCPNRASENLRPIVAWADGDGRAAGTGFSAEVLKGLDRVSGLVSDSDDPTQPDGEFDAPTITCQRCDREWDLSEEFDELGVGNHAVEQFALDHRRHTGHFPDGVETWRAICRNCPEEAERLSADAATRWAETHARHTRHRIAIHHAHRDETTIVGET